jgi:hypothetical protein
VVVEQLPSARAQERKDVLEVRRGAGCGANCRRIEWASPRGKEEDARQTAADLESMRAEVFVRKAVARDMENRPQKKCCKPRAAGCAGRSACRHVECNYHSRLTIRPNDESRLDAFWSGLARTRHRTTVIAASLSKTTDAVRAAGACLPAEPEQSAFRWLTCSD